MSLRLVRPELPARIMAILSDRNWPALVDLLESGFPPNAAWPGRGALFDLFVLAASTPAPPVPGTAIHRAQMHALEAFVQAGLSPCPALGEEAGSLPLAIAALSGRPDFVRRLLQAAHAPGGLGRLHQSPLAVLALRASSKMAPLRLPFARVAACVHELVEAGADLNQPTQEGWFPLTLAAAQGDAELACLLLDLGALPDARAPGFPRGPGPRYSATAWAVERDDARLLGILLERGAGLGMPYRPGIDVVEAAGRVAGPDAWREIVARRGLADPAVRRGFFQAVIGDRATLVHWFLCAGMSATQCGEHGFSPLDVACEHQAFGVIDRLLAAGANPGVSAQDGLTPVARLRAAGGTRALARAGWLPRALPPAGGRARSGANLGRSRARGAQ